jgi:hypothetical protein
MGELSGNPNSFGWGFSDTEDGVPLFKNGELLKVGVCGSEGDSTDGNTSSMAGGQNGACSFGC